MNLIGKSILLIAILNILFGQLTFQDGFSSNQGWTSNQPDDIYISENEGGSVSFHADRGVNQDFYIPIDSFSGNFQLSVRHKVTNRTNNCWISIGLISDVDGFINNNPYPESGIMLEVGWYGGGTPFSVYFVRPTVRYLDGSIFSPSLGDVNPGGSGPDPDGYLPYEEDQWFTSKMMIVGNTILLQLFDDSGEYIDERTWEFPEGELNYNYVYIGNGDTHDWPSMDGFIDDIIITNENQFTFQDGFSSNQGWTSNQPDDIYISENEGGSVSFHADRGVNQDFYIPIDSFSGNFQLSVRHKVTNRTNNCWISIGLISDVDGFINNNPYPESGIMLEVGWYGGGTPFSVYFVRPTVRYLDGSIFSPSLGDVNPGGSGPDPDGYLPYEEDQWFTSKMMIVGNTILLQLFDDSGEYIDERTWQFPVGELNYNYVYIGNGDTQDWPSMDGFIDDISITNNFDIYQMEIPFFDDFTYDAGWINESINSFLIENGKLNWSVERSNGITEKLYIPTQIDNQILESFNLQFDFKITSTSPNCGFYTGFISSLNNGDAWFLDYAGIFIDINSYSSSKRIRLLQTTENEGFYESNTIQISIGIFYHLELIINGQNYQLIVTEAENLMGFIEGTLPYDLPSNYDYFGFGGPNDGQGGNISGILDNISLFVEENDDIVLLEPPIISSIEDISNDQGGWVTVSFYKSIYDTDSLRTPESYTIEANYGNGWITTVSGNAYAEMQYSYQVHTQIDSSSNTGGYIDFRVIAGMDEGNFASDVVQGYSVDNIIPAEPVGMTLQYDVNDNQLTMDWQPNIDDDLSHYVIAQNGEILAAPIISEFNTELNLGTGVYNFSLKAIDIHGNESNTVGKEIYIVNHNLSSGNNLISIPGTFENDNSIEILNNLMDYGPDVNFILGQGIGLFNTENGWSGNLNNISSQEGYWLNISSNYEWKLYPELGPIDNCESYEIGLGNNLLSFRWDDGNKSTLEALGGEAFATQYFNFILGQGVGLFNTENGWSGNLNMLEEGKGYWVNVSNSNMDFRWGFNNCDSPESTILVKEEVVNVIPEEYQFIQSTQQAFYLINEIIIDGKNPEENDILLAYNNDILVGSAVYNPELTVLPVMGKDISKQTEGFLEEGEIPTLKLVKSSKESILVDADLEGFKNLLITEISKISGISNALPADFALHPAYPNPFNPVTTINFSVPETVESLPVTILQIFNVNGQLIETLHDNQIEPGYHTIQWNAEGLPSGVYFIQMTVDGTSSNLGQGFTATQKVVLMK